MLLLLLLLLNLLLLFLLAVFHPLLERIKEFAMDGSLVDAPVPRAVEVGAAIKSGRKITFLWM